jgi:hypothetical protein
MSALSLSSPFPIFTDVDGNPLEDGYVYVGTAGLNPETNPIQVYWDAALTAPAAQPIRTLGGYPSNSGSAGRLYVNADDCSMTVRNKNGSLIFSALNQTDRFSSALIGFTQSGTGAVASTVQEKLREIVSVKDFGAVGDGVTDDTAAIQAAIDSIGSTGGTIFFHVGDYLITSGLDVGTKPGVHLIGWAAQNQPIEESGARIVTSEAITMLTAGSAAATVSSGIHISNMSFVSSDNTALEGIKIFRSNFCRLTNVSVGNLTAGVGIYFDGGGDSCTLPQLDSVFVRNCKFPIKLKDTAAARITGRSYATCGVSGGSPIASSVGLVLEAAETTYLDGFACDLYAQGIYIDSNSNRTVAVGTRLEGGAAGGVSVNIEGDNTLFIGTQVLGDVGVAQTGFSIAASASYTRVLDSVYALGAGSTKVSDAGTYTIVRDMSYDYDKTPVPHCFGTTVTTDAIANELVLPNNRALRMVNAAGTSAKNVVVVATDDTAKFSSPKARVNKGDTLLELRTETNKQGLNLLAGDAAPGTKVNISLPDTLTSNTVGAAGGSAALPANPTAYLSVWINGTERKIPYYEV